MRVLVEGAVIVGSILLAFALEAWGQERAAAAWELEQLHMLRDEFVDNGELLQSAVAGHDGRVADVSEILAFLESATPGETRVIRDRVLASLVSWSTSDISTGTLDGLLASGGLGDIEDPRLRGALAAWPTVVGDAREDETLGREFVEMVLAPALLGMGVLPAAYAARPGPEVVEGDFERSPPDAQTVIAFNPILRDAAAVRLLHLRLASASMASLRAKMQDMVSLIDQAIGDR